MENKNQRLNIYQLRGINQAAVVRMIWLLVAAGVVGLVVTATPQRYQMLLTDVYGFSPGLQSIGVSLSFFAIYFTALELLLVVGSLSVAALIAWRRADDWFAMLVAVTLILFGVIPPLADGLIFAVPQWAVPISALRLAAFAAMLAVISLFPNGRFVPPWTRWLILLWITICSAAFLNNPLLMADMAVLPNMHTIADSLWLLVGAGWFTVAIMGQIIRYHRYATAAEKQQMKWVLWGFTLVIPVSVISILLLIAVPALQELPDSRVHFTLVMGGLMLLAGLTIPVTIALSILRYRLWDVDILLNRTLVYGGVTALITVLYILLVGGVGTLAVGTQSNLAASMVATLLVMLGIRPLHRWLESQANKFVPIQKTIAAPKKTSRTIFVKWLRRGWVINLLLVSSLFVVGIAEQANYFQYPAVISQLSDVAISRLIAEKIFITNPAFTPWILIASYGQAVTFTGVGLFIFQRKSNDVMGIVASWMFLSVGIGFTPTIVSLPILAPAWHIPVTIFQIGMFGTTVLFLTLFPNGRFYPQWSKRLFYAWFIFMLFWIPFPQLNLHRSSAIWPAFVFVLIVVFGIIAQLFRYWLDSDESQKQQTKWVIVGFTFANSGLLGILLLTQQNLLLSSPFQLAGLLFLALGPILIPATITIALTRHRLWQIDIIINRTLVYGGLTAVILLTYALLVGGFSLLWRSQNNLLISLLATGLIAVLFQPVRDRLQRAANRLMFGERDEPYVVLSKLGAQLQTTATPQAMLQSVVETTAATLKLPYAAIELADEQGRLKGAATGKTVAETAEFPLRYQNETVGYLIVTPRSPGETFSDREQQLLRDIAGQTGAMAYAVRLTAALQRSAAALQQSREKLVLAREEERRRIRRDLHDELGPTLASQTFALDAALDVLERDPQAAAKLLQNLKTQNQATVADIRRLVYELRPPTLDELGIMGALQAHVVKLDGHSLPHIQITADPDPLPPLSAAVEVAAYRIALEAITNAVRHARAQRCNVCLQVVDNGHLDAAGTGRATLQITVSDDGIGLPPDRRPGVGLNSMRERAEELGGSLAAGNEKKGARVTALLPL